MAAFWLLTGVMCCCRCQPNELMVINKARVKHRERILEKDYSPKSHSFSEIVIGLHNTSRFCRLVLCTWSTLCCYSPGIVLFATNNFLIPIFAVSRNSPSGAYPDVWDLCETQRISSNQVCEGRICNSWEASVIFIFVQNTHLSNRPSSGCLSDNMILI